MHRRYTAVAIGASAGGVQALMELVRGLPADLEVPIFVTLHVPAHARSALPELLQRCGPLRAVHPFDGEAVRGGTIYVAPPNRHLLLRNGHVHLSRGPKEAGSRPAADPMLDSVSRVHREGTIGIILSGMLDDGSAGLVAVRRAGGMAIVQDPASAAFPDMPLHALESAGADHVLPPERIAATLAELLPRRSSDPAAPPVGQPAFEEDPDAMNEDVLLDAGASSPQTPSVFTCPDCGGVLNGPDAQVGTFKFRCQVGHVWNGRALLSAQLDTVEESLWVALRVLEEHKRLTGRLLEDARQRNFGSIAERYQENLQEADFHASQIRRLLDTALHEEDAAADIPSS